MSHSLTSPPGPSRSARRVRHEVRDTLTVMAFSAVASVTVAVLLGLAVRVGG